MMHSRDSGGSGEAPLLEAGTLFPVDAGRTGALITGPHLLFTEAYRWQAHLHAGGYRSRNIDCAMRFNPFVLVDESIRMGLPPEEALLQTTIQRAFTPYQILDALHGVADRPPKEEERVVYFLLAPAKQFFDGDVSHPEAEYLLRKMDEVLAGIRRQGTPMVVLEQPAYRSDLFAPFLEGIRRLHHFNREVLASSDGTLRVAVPAMPAPHRSLMRASVKDRDVDSAGRSGARPGKGLKGGKSHGTNATSILHADRTGGFQTQGLSPGPAKRGAAAL